MWIVLAFISALCLGCYDISKKMALRENKVVDVLTLSICVSAVLLSMPLLLSRYMPETMSETPFFVPQLDLKGHLLTVLKSVIVLSSWIFAYISLKQLPLSVVSPMQATRPMWTLVGAVLIFGERLNGWQWAGVLIAIGTIFLFSFTHKSEGGLTHTQEMYKYYFCLALAILIGACSGLYDKFLMRRYDHNAVQVYYTLYQAVMMLIAWLIVHKRESGKVSIQRVGVIMLISIFLIISDNVYMLALRDPDSLIAVVSTIRRGGTVIGFAYGLIFLQEKNAIPKICCMAGIILGLICLALGSM
ncbi:MAG: DMT family transporter [Paludibacteraceae bacterium]|nr:DMT family transporter [Paludibacteraceae bacterium]